jgi:predicted ester cyclase
MPASTDAASGTGAVVTALYEAYNSHDAEAAGALYAPDGRHAEVATGQARTGGTAIAEGLAGLLAAFPDARWEEQARIVDGDRAAVTYILTGTLQQKFGPFEPAGQRLELRGAHVLEVGPDGIRVCEDYWDASSFGRQMKAPA